MSTNTKVRYGVAISALIAIAIAAFAWAAQVSSDASVKAYAPVVESSPKSEPLEVSEPDTATMAASIAWESMTASEQSTLCVAYDVLPYSEAWGYVYDGAGDADIADAVMAKLAIEC